MESEALTKGDMPVSSSTVFISYSHDSENHKDKVAGLYTYLVKNGVDCTFDQEIETPPEGWPRWMTNIVKASDYVLIICTETYKRRFEGHEEEGKGKGGTWEGAVITQSIYNDGSFNTKYIPIVLDNGDKQHIPTVLEGATHYHMPSDLKKLYARLTNQRLFEKPDLGQVKKLAPQAEADTSWLESALTVDAIRFNWDDLRTVILAFHDVVVPGEGSTENKSDFFNIDLDQKNGLNNMGQHYAQMITDHHEQYFGKIDKFLKNPVNSDIRSQYFEVVEELRSKIAVMRPKVDNFEKILLAFVDEAVKSDTTLQMKRSVLNVLVSFMYVNCEIGQKS